MLKFHNTLLQGITKTDYIIMTGGQIIFIIITALTALMAVMAITSRSVRKAAAYLLAVLVVTSGLFLILKFYTLAVIHLLLCAGGIALLLLKPSRLSKLSLSPEKETGWIRPALSGIVAIAGLFITILTLMNFRFAPISSSGDEFRLLNVSKNLISTGKNGFILPVTIITLLVIISIISVSELSGRTGNTVKNKNRKK